MAEQQLAPPGYHLIGIFTRFSSWTARVEAVLEHFQIPYSKQFVPLEDASKVSPSGLVPILEWRSPGEAPCQINDSLAICEFLSERHPHLYLWPRDPVLRAMARCAAAEMHSGFTALRNTFYTNFIAQYTGDIPVPELARKEIRRLLTIWDNARQLARTRLAEVNENDDGFLFGSFSIADAFFWPILWRIRTYDLPIDSASSDVLTWMETMWNAPTTRKLIRGYYLQVELPESRIERYEDIFRDRNDIEYEYGRFPEEWTFVAPRRR